MTQRREDHKTGRIGLRRRFITPVLAGAMLCSGCVPGTPSLDPAPSAGGAGTTQRAPSSTPAAPPSPPDAPSPSPTVPAPVSAAPSSLDDDIATILAEADGYRVSVALADVSGGAAKIFGDESEFTAASTSKILTAAAFFHLVETGEASIDEPVGNGDAASQIQAMVNNSNNDAWLLLMQAIGYPRLIEYAESIGVIYDPEENLLAAADMALVLQLLSAGELLNQDHTAQLLGYMEETNYERLIPAGSHPDVTVQHKYGQLNGYLHDAALLSFRDSTSVLVIYTESTGSEGEAGQIQLIRALTRVVEDALFELGEAGDVEAEKATS